MVRWSRHGPTRLVCRYGVYVTTVREMSGGLLPPRMHLSLPRSMNNRAQTWVDMVCTYWQAIGRLRLLAKVVFMS
jgi:hypothetical protein